MRLLIALAAIVSVPAFAACPDLSGRYACTDHDGNIENHEVTQSLQNGVTVYVLDKEMTFPADNQSHTLPGNSLKNGKFTAVCDQNGTLNVQVDGLFYWGQTYEGVYTAIHGLSKSGSDLTWTQAQTLKPPTGADRFSSDSLACKPL